MYTSYKFICALILTFIIQIGTAQSTFKNALSNFGGFFDVETTLDKGFIGCAYTNKTYVVKLDENGKLVWSMSLADLNGLQPIKITTSGDDEDIFMLGRMGREGTESFVVVKLTKDGSYIKSREISQTSSNQGHDLISDGEDGVIVTGGGCNGNNIVFRFDNDLELIWAKGYGFPINTSAISIIELQNGNFLIGCIVSTYTPAKHFGFLEIDKRGDLLSEKVYSGHEKSIIKQVQELENGDIAVLATADLGVDSLGERAIVLRLSNDLKIKWSVAVNTDGLERLNDLVELGNGNLMCTGFSHYGKGGDGLIATFFPDGTPDYFRNIPGELAENRTHEEINSIIPGCEDKYAVFGVLDGIGLGFVNDAGEGFCDSELIPDGIFNVALLNLEPVSGQFSVREIEFFYSEYKVTVSEDMLEETLFCDYTDTEVQKCQITTNENKIIDKEVSMRPNPVTTTLYLELPDPGDITMSISDSQGRQVMHKRKIQSSIEVSALSEGIYFVSLWYDNQVIIKRFIKT